MTPKLHSCCAILSPIRAKQALIVYNKTEVSCLQLVERTCKLWLKSNWLFSKKIYSKSFLYQRCPTSPIPWTMLQPIASLHSRTHSKLTVMQQHAEVPKSTYPLSSEKHSLKTSLLKEPRPLRQHLLKHPLLLLKTAVQWTNRKQTSRIFQNSQMASK